MRSLLTSSPLSCRFSLHGWQPGQWLLTEVAFKQAVKFGIGVVKHVGGAKKVLAAHREAFAGMGGGVVVDGRCFATCQAGLKVVPHRHENAVPLLSFNITW